MKSGTHDWTRIPDDRVGFSDTPGLIKPEFSRISVRHTSCLENSSLTSCIGGDLSRLPRVVIPGLPHHVTQRGNRRQTAFFSDNDFELYLQLMALACRSYHVDIWAYCLMPNHVHLIAVPPSETALSKAVGFGHEAYTRKVNDRNGWRGYLWQGRFSSFPMDESHLLLAARYIELNPVRAGLVEKAEDYLWSSTRSHLFLSDDGLVNREALLLYVPDWREFLEEGVLEDDADLLEKHQRSGRPLGSRVFLERLERTLGRSLIPRKPGPSPKPFLKGEFGSSRVSPI